MAPILPFGFRSAESMQLSFPSISKSTVYQSQENAKKRKEKRKKNENKKPKTKNRFRFGNFLRITIIPSHMTACHLTLSRVSSSTHQSPPLCSGIGRNVLLPFVRETPGILAKSR
jgi:hypothetical protein